MLEDPNEGGPVRSPHGTFSDCPKKVGIFHDTDFIPVLRPKLATADGIVGYLRRIDESRIYSNFGPLSYEFQRRMAEIFHVGSENFVTASCGTTALIGAILATAGTATRSRPFALLPSFTFAATAIAVERCGFRPYLADVDATNWMLNPVKLLNHPRIDQIGVVVPVAPFGRPLPQADWITFSEHSGIPVVFDAAASFACISQRSGRSFIGPIPTVLSFHATKSFGIGEGGGIISTDSALAMRITSALNFGFRESRDSAVPSVNGKLSEFHAAVGLAELDGWDEKYAALQRVTRAYKEQFSSCGFGNRFVGSPEVDASYALFKMRGRQHCDERRGFPQALRRRLQVLVWAGIAVPYSLLECPVRRLASDRSSRTMPHWTANGTRSAAQCNQAHCVGSMSRCGSSSRRISVARMIGRIVHREAVIAENEGFLAHTDESGWNKSCLFA